MKLVGPIKGIPRKRCAYCEKKKSVRKFRLRQDERIIARGLHDDDPRSRSCYCNACATIIYRRYKKEQRDRSKLKLGGKCSFCPEERLPALIVNGDEIYCWNCRQVRMIEQRMLDNGDFFLLPDPQSGVGHSLPDIRKELAEYEN
jgi:hypothetical protein